jgi:putative redox protein
MGDVKRARLGWRAGMVFEGNVAGKAPIVLDAGGPEGPSPMEGLLLALAGCTGSDVVSILQKKRADLRALAVEVAGERRDEHPKRYTAITLTFRITAPGLEEAQARRAIDLSLEKYCSVTHSLSRDIALRYELALEA